MIDLLILIPQCLLSLMFVVLAFLAFVFYFANYVEERMETTKQILKKITYMILILTLIMPFSDLPIHLFALILSENLLWLYVQFNNFPFISVNNPIFFLSFIITIFAHVDLMMYFFSNELSFIVIISYFFLFIWMIPILIIASLCALDEDQIENKNEKKQNKRKQKTQ